MFFQLVWKEMEYQTRNITLYLFIAVVLMFYSTQFMPYISQGTPLEPQPGAQYYGIKAIEDKESEIKAVYLDMQRSYSAGYILKQSVLINKVVNLSEDELNVMKTAMEQLAVYKHREGSNPMENVAVKASYEEYLQIVRELDKKLGGSTYYGDKYRKFILQQPMTYEDAMTEFETIKTKDKITNAYGRLFADYMGITAGLFPVFLAAFVMTRDKRSKMQELIYSRSIGSFSYIASKYVALLAILVTFYMAITAHATYGVVSQAQQGGYAVEILALFKYTITWLIPTLMFTIAVGMLVSLLLNNGVVAIFVQFVLWLVSITSLGGNYEFFRSIIRFNALGEYDSYISYLPQIIANRVFYTLFSIALLIAASWILSRKRGAANGSKIYKADMVQQQDIA